MRKSLVWSYLSKKQVADRGRSTTNYRFPYPDHQTQFAICKDKNLFPFFNIFFPSQEEEEKMTRDVVNPSSHSIAAPSFKLVGRTLSPVKSASKGLNLRRQQLQLRNTQRS